MPVANVQVKTCSTPPEKDHVVTDHLAKTQATAAIEGYIGEDTGDSGGEGMYRERDEFVVKIDDVESLKVIRSLLRYCYVLTLFREPSLV